MQYNVYVQGKKYRLFSTKDGVQPVDIYDQINEDIKLGDLVVDESMPLDIRIVPVGTSLFE